MNLGRCPANSIFVSPLTISAKPVGVGAALPLSIPRGGRSGLLTRMVYLIGANHFVRHDGLPAVMEHHKAIIRATRVTCKAHVLEVIRKLGVSILAEESSGEAPQTHN